TISSIQSTSITQTGATLSWTTNESADSQIDYGLTTAYGSQTSLDSTLVTSHSQTLSTLQPTTTYHYRVRAKDFAGNLAQSSDQVFTTQAAIIIPSGNRVDRINSGGTLIFSTSTIHVCANIDVVGDTC